MKQLGFELTNDIALDNGMRWLTEFIQPSAGRPYGVEAILRGNPGNWCSFTQQKVSDFTQRKVSDGDPG